MGGGTLRAGTESPGSSSTAWREETPSPRPQWMTLPPVCQPPRHCERVLAGEMTIDAGADGDTPLALRWWMTDDGEVRRDGPLGRHKPLLAACLFFAFAAWLFTSFRTSLLVTMQLRSAPVCAPNEAFASTSCRVVLAGTVTKLTHYSVGLNIDGHEVSMAVLLSGDESLSHFDGTHVQITMYRGEPLHVEGSGLNMDARGSPAKGTETYRIGASFFLLVGLLAVCADLVMAKRRRRRDG